jgi:hypothetical protein
MVAQQTKPLNLSRPPELPSGQSPHTLLPDVSPLPGHHQRFTTSAPPTHPPPFPAQPVFRPSSSLTQAPAYDTLPQMRFPSPYPTIHLPPPVRPPSAQPMRGPQVFAADLSPYLATPAFSPHTQISPLPGPIWPPSAQPMRGPQFFTADSSPYFVTPALLPHARIPSGHERQIHMSTHQPSLLVRQIPSHPQSPTSSSIYYSSALPLSQQLEPTFPSPAHRPSPHPSVSQPSQNHFMPSNSYIRPQWTLMRAPEHGRRLQQNSPQVGLQESRFDYGHFT